MTVSPRTAAGCELFRPCRPTWLHRRKMSPGGRACLWPVAPNLNSKGMRRELPGGYRRKTPKPTMGAAHRRRTRPGPRASVHHSLKPSDATDAVVFLERALPDTWREGLISPTRRATASSSPALPPAQGYANKNAVAAMVEARRRRLLPAHLMLSPDAALLLKSGDGVGIQAGEGRTQPARVQDLAEVCQKLADLAPVARAGVGEILRRARHGVKRGS